MPFSIFGASSSSNKRSAEIAPYQSDFGGYLNDNLQETSVGEQTWTWRFFLVFWCALAISMQTLILST